MNKPEITFRSAGSPYLYRQYKFLLTHSEYQSSQASIYYSMTFPHSANKISSQRLLVKKMPIKVPQQKWILDKIQEADK